MVHVCIHLPEQEILGGPVSYRWMYMNAIERCMDTYKGFVRNTVQPNGSIAKAYVIDEELTFLSRYINNIDPMFNWVDINWDNMTSNIMPHLDIFSANFRTLGAYELKELSD